MGSHPAGQRLLEECDLPGKGTMDTDDLKLALERQRGENKELVEALLQLEADYAQLEQDRAEVQEEVGRLRRATVAVEETDEVWEELDSTKSSLLHVQQELKLLKRQRESLEEEKQEMRGTIQELTTEVGLWQARRGKLARPPGWGPLARSLSQRRLFSPAESHPDQGELPKPPAALGGAASRQAAKDGSAASQGRERRAGEGAGQGKAPLLRADGDNSGATGDPGGPSEQNKPTERRAGGFGTAERATRSKWEPDAMAFCRLPLAFHSQKLEQGEDLSGSLLCEIVEAKLETRLVAKRRGITYWLWTLASLYIWLQLLAGSVMAAAVLYTYFFDGEFIYRTLPLVLSEHGYDQLASGMGGHLTLHSQGLLPF